MRAHRLSSAIAGSAAIAIFVVGVVFGTHAAGGSDSSCYLNAAKFFARGELTLRQPLARTAPWKNAVWTFAPAGFVPSPVAPDALVPICSPGLPMAMAAFRVLGLSEFLVVPVLGALAVWLTFVIGRRLDRPLTGAGAALLTAVSPTFLYQAVQPMSDVPATALWLLAIAWSIERENGSRRPGLAGLAASTAVLIRPNLLPLAGVIAAYLFATRRRSADERGVLRFAAGLLPGLLVLALLQWAMYGSPVATGYGNARDLMSMAHVAPNLRRYVGWLLDVHTPVLLLAVASPLLIRRARHAWLCLALAGATLAAYLPYIVFDDWWYTRFLLPAIPLLIILAVAVLVAGIDRIAGSISQLWRPAFTGPVDAPRPRSMAVDWSILCVLLVVAASWLVTARDRRVFELSELEQHYYRAGIAAARVPEPSMMVTVRNSGSVLYHTGSPIVAWDTLESGMLDAVFRFAREQGFEPYLLLEIDEEPVFRDRFSAATAIGALDWPPRVQVGRTIRIYDPLDRARFLSNSPIPTEFIPDSPGPSRDWRRWLR